MQECKRYGTLCKGSKSYTRKGAFSITLAEVRKAQGITQHTLARLSGVSRGTIARFETGKCSPMLQTLEKLAKALGVTVSDIAGVKA